MNSKDIQQIIDKATKDPKFFHDLVFSPEKAISALTSLDNQSKASLLSIVPEFEIRRIIGKLSWCGDTCGSSSCIDTCGARSCDHTCADSCGTTCSHSCTDTTKNVFRIDEIINIRNQAQNTKE